MALADSSTSTTDRVLAAVALVGLGALLFVAGGVVTSAKIFPGTLIADAYKGGVALYEKNNDYVDPLTTDLWYPAKTKNRGVTVNLAGKAQAGDTLCTSGHKAAAFLIGMDGKVIHEWDRPYSTVWNKTAAVKAPVPDDRVYFRKAELMPDGGLLAIYEGAGDTPYGYGMVRLDKDSNVMWSYLQHTHHSFDVGADGTIYALTQDFDDEPTPDFDNIAQPFMDDYLVVLSPDGKELKKIDLYKAVANSNYRQLLYTIDAFSSEDPLHTNDVQVITEDQAKVFPFGKAGQILISFRNLGAVGVLDIDQGKVVWATRGSWLGQHDVDLTKDGHILLFDNFGNQISPSGRSRVLEFDPTTMQIVWQYAGTPDHPLQSLIRASQERLANGDTLITESEGGRMVEVAPDGTIVWEFLNPIRAGDNDSKIPIICWGQRYDSDAVAAALGQGTSTSTRTAMEIKP